MISSAPKPLPLRRAELTIRPLGERGQHVVKDPATGEFFHLGAEEHFLLMRLDGRASIEDIRVELGLGQITACSLPDAPQIRQLKSHEFT